MTDVQTTAIRARKRKGVQRSTAAPPASWAGWAGRWECSCGAESDWWLAESAADAPEAIRQRDEDRAAHSCERTRSPA